jgi:hypothetical protein
MILLSGLNQKPSLSIRKLRRVYPMTSQIGKPLSLKENRKQLSGHPLLETLLFPLSLSLRFS